MNNKPYHDTPGERVFQPYVYRLAHFLAERSGVRSIIDVGCGSGEKLRLFPADTYQLTCIDAAPGIELARRSVPRADFIEFDLERGLPELPEELIRRSIILCADVAEHLKQPERLLRGLAEWSASAPYVLISTPDRDRVRGWLDDGPPDNRAHTMEWNASEFVRLMRACGFDGVPFYGHTINTDVQKAKSTLLTLTGRNTARPQPAGKEFRVAAIIHTYNEADMIQETVEHLLAQGVEVHVFDNWSSDGTWDLITHLMNSGKVVHGERFPPEDQGEFRLKTQLEKTADYAATLDANWVIHHDADEIRCSPWDGVSLKDALACVDRLGFNAVDFTVLDFRFLEIQPEAQAPYQASLTHFEFGRRPGHFRQVKAWKNSGKVDLSRGGHEAVFPERNVYPLKFLMKHYPLRNLKQANQKVFQDRLPRMEAEQRERGWHTQYNEYAEPGEIKGWRSTDLLPWHPVYFLSEFLVERISGIGLLEEPGFPPSP